MSERKEQMKTVVRQELALVNAQELMNVRPALRLRHMLQQLTILDYLRKLPKSALRNA
jgi:hypothetical protein